jgi:hypothetical protein
MLQQNGTLWVVLMGAKNSCKFYLLFLKGFLMEFLLATERRTLGIGQRNFLTLCAARWGLMRL